MRSRSLTSFNSPFFPAGQGAAARQERRKGSVRYESGGALAIRSAFCFVWQSEADDYLNPGARQRKAEATGLRSIYHLMYAFVRKKWVFVRIT
ncbi:hypothetical protein BTR22_03930 [Alkalihalophilus pseudofirmus]|nr:hypothetical protein BTR22_03930 [Alkalihalophilus pseudofirmus]